MVSLSGYATTARGARLIFSILGNNNNLHAQDADTVLDAIAVAMIEELGPAPVTKEKEVKEVWEVKDVEDRRTIRWVVIVGRGFSRDICEFISWGFSP